MKFLFDYFPIVFFFIAFKLWGIYVATAIAMGTSVLQVSAYWLRHRKFEKFHIIVLVFILVLGSLTLIFHNPIFIKWKPSIVYWVFAIALFGSHFVGSKPLMHKLFQDKVELPDKVLSHLSHSWIIFFLIMGIVNLIVVYHASTNAWVNFKLFGTLGLTLLMIIIQVSYIARYLKNIEKKDMKIGKR